MLYKSLNVLAGLSSLGKYNYAQEISINSMEKISKMKTPI